ncbi:unnamed protein product [Caenorhabditis brenneri]
MTDTTYDVLFYLLFYVCGPVSAIYLLILYAIEAHIYSKSKREGPITLTPVIPFPQDDLHIFKGTNDLKNVVPEAKIQVCNGKTETSQGFPRFNSHRKYAVYHRINVFMASTFKLHRRLRDEYELKESIFCSVPRNARTISIKMDGYEHGEKCHDFVPIGGAAPGSHFTYQMYGDNRIQVTRYVMDGKSDIAGFCIYVEHAWLSPTEYRWSSIANITRFVKIPENSPITGGRRSVTNQPKIEVNPEENTNLMSHDSDDREWTVKYCSERQRKVISSTDSGGIILHQEWSDKDNRMKIEKCNECTEDGLENEEQPPAYSSIFVV